jgi:hypothetical protein
MVYYTIYFYKFYLQSVHHHCVKIKEWCVHSQLVMVNWAHDIGGIDANYSLQSTEMSFNKVRVVQTSQQIVGKKQRSQTRKRRNNCR